MPTAPTPIMKRKLNLVVFIIIIAVAVYISINLFSVSVVKAEYYRAKANNQQLTSFTIQANRGTIYDTSGKVFAQSTTVWDVIMSPADLISDEQDCKKKELICRTLSEICEVDYDKLYSAVVDNETNVRYYMVKPKVDKETHDKIATFITKEKLGYNSIQLVENSKRSYPNDSLASSVIGFTNYDNEGIYGVEAYYNEYLKGVDGRVVVPRSAKGDSMPYGEEIRRGAINGNSIVLTIDEVVQHYLEKALETTVSQHKVENRATGIIMNAKTGAILAMATSPTYDLNYPSTLSEIDLATLAGFEAELKEDPKNTADDVTEKMAEKKSVLRERQWNNKAISELYFPGSVFKVITCASALEEQVVGLNSTFQCAGIIDVAGTKIHCWSSAGHGTSTLTEAITKSCNPAFIKIGQLLGKDKFCDYFEGFGFTEKTGIDLPGETSSLYVPRDKMGPVELASSSFGQTNKVTPMQMICAYAAAVNGGKLLTPYVVEKILDNEGNVTKSTTPHVKRQVISEQTSKQMQSILKSVVTTNGGSNAYIAGYSIGGKSGTSEKLDEPREADGGMKYMSTFCAFTPAEDPEYVMLVVVDHPTGGKFYGSAVAAPVVSSVFKDSLEYLGIYPQYTAEEQAHLDTTVPYVIGQATMAATTALNTQGLNAKFVGNTEGTTVKYTIPSSGGVIPKNGTVVLYMEDMPQTKVTVPNVVGLSVTEANTIITNASLNIRLVGGGIDNAKAKATMQSVEAGSEVGAGTVVEVTFVINDETG